MFPRLSSKLANRFATNVRGRGSSYYAAGWVKILSGTPTSVVATVKGSEHYNVDVGWVNGDLHWGCNCPYFASEGPCKHLWAALVAAEFKGHLTGVGAIRRVIEVEPEDEDVDDVILPPPPPAVPNWKAKLGNFTKPTFTPEWPTKREIHYLVDLRSSVVRGQLILLLYAQDRKMNGELSRMVPLAMEKSLVPSLPAADRAIVSLLLGASTGWEYGGATAYGPVPASVLLPYPLSATVLRMAIRSGHCYATQDTRILNLTRLEWDEGVPWRFGLRLGAGTGPGLKFEGVLRRGEETMPVTQPLLVTPGGLVFTEGRVALLDEDTPFDWLANVRHSGPLEVPERDVDELLAMLLATPGLPAIEFPPHLRYDEVSGVPRPALHIRAPKHSPDGKRLSAELVFDYDGRPVKAGDSASGVVDAAARRLIRRDPVAEDASRQFLEENSVKRRPVTAYDPHPGWDLAASKLPKIARALVQAGWHVEAEGKLFRAHGAFQLAVASGVDWFELQGEVNYGETSARLPALLEARRRGEDMVLLDDGTYGLLPEEWLRQIGTFSAMGTAVDGQIRFRRSQAGLLDALLATQPQATFDAQFATIRDEMRNFEGIAPIAQPPGFTGRLRDYQCEGLGWMDFLRRFSFGGCLADDMGVGKTAQVLAMLEARRGLHGPSLVVVPRSLIFNWKEEAKRFTPQMRVLDHTGIGRDLNLIPSHDLILTTYGTLRRDAALLHDIEFDYVVLDEAQSVKNASSEAAKAVRLLKGRHRLALSGTPVENHLGELWSLFEFLNPGMLGAASIFQVTGTGRTMEAETRTLLAKALRPFILRRTKEQVVRELPAKTEQTIYCELDAPQRKLYNELRQHYRDLLLKRIETEGLAKSKIMVLEALLRLRQAACHPGLIDPKRTGEPSAKMEALEEQLKEVLEAGHKALVFSQFTSLLKILRTHLDQQGVVYEYLDGKTRDRQAKVDRFQTNAKCPLFLISLKAGGLGLNLTAAEYVFLLDPWWNPAVEAQAVDRAHRIGQQRAVFAYRLIARDTVEEKVLDLQNTKRDLAASILREDNSLIRDLGREDLERLLS